MKTIVFNILLLFISLGINAQQEGLYTQFAFNKIAFNPGIAGENNYTTITAVNRNQWSGIVGGPNSKFINANLGSFDKKYGLAFSVSKNSVGIQDRIEVSTQLAYKLQLLNGFINLGLQISGRRYTNDFTDPALTAIDGFELDPSIAREVYSNTVANLGVGLYLQIEDIYAGISAPRMIRGDIDSESDNLFTKEERHVFAMAGSKLQLNNDWIYHPQFLFKVTKNSPFNLDFLSLFSYQDKIHIGGNIRSGGSQQSFFESFDMLLGFQFTTNIFAGMSYDFTFSELSQYENGSFELLLSYTFEKSNFPKKISNPRYF